MKKHKPGDGKKRIARGVIKLRLKKRPKIFGGSLTLPPRLKVRP